MTKIIKVKSYECAVCKFNWNLPPNVEPIKEVVDSIFTSDPEYIKRIHKAHKDRREKALLNNEIPPSFPTPPSAFECPNCILQGINGNLLTPTMERTTVTIRNEESIDSDTKLSANEKKELKQKVKDDIIKFSAMQ